MRTVRVLAGVALLSTLIVVSSEGVQSQEKKEGGKVKGQLPAGWGKLDLTAAQKEEIYKINAEYKERTDKLRDEIKKLDAEHAKKRLAVLTDEQKKKLVETLAGEPKEKSKEPPKKEPEKK
jgi:Spy/CpxP family protein refolding chaperone